MLQGKKDVSSAILGGKYITTPSHADSTAQVQSMQLEQVGNIS